MRERRQELGVDVKTITEVLGFSRDYWSAIDNDRKILAEEKLQMLLDQFEFDDDERKELLDLRDPQLREHAHPWFAANS